MSTSARVTSFGRAFAGEAQETEITFIAASIAYSAFISLLPVLLLGGGSVVASRVTANRIRDGIRGPPLSSTRSLVKTSGVGEPRDEPAESKAGGNT